MATPRPKVLVVDDTDANLVAMEALLSKLPCETVLARSGREALTLMLKHSFAVVLLDVQMSGMDGYEVASTARSYPSTSETPIVFITAMHSAEEDALRGYSAGAVDFIFKPVNPAILSGKVKVFLELWNGKQRLAEEIEAHKETITDRESFNYAVSHDLRAPLRAVEGFSAVLLEDFGEKLGPEGRDHLERIRSAAQRMDQLIEDMLMLSRMAKTQMNPTRVDLALLAGDVVADLRQAEPQRQVRFTSVESAPVVGDARLLRILLENLLRNAWKFTRHVKEPAIELGRHESPHEPAWFVRDNGAGFDSTKATGIFQPFRRMHLASEFEGTGIGLAIAQRIVRRHGGRIWAEAAVGKGATLFFTLPAPGATAAGSTAPR